MKLTNTQNVKASKSGMTLLELTVVILVLLSLISILFIGARAWKRGSDRAASVLQIRNCQQAVRSFSNMNGLNPGDDAAAMALKVVGFTDLPSEIFGTGNFIENTPIGANHPAGAEADYVWGPDGGVAIPAVGVLYVTTDNPEYAPLATDITDW